MSDKEVQPESPVSRGIRAFLMWCRMEKGLSRNSLEAYGSDLARFREFVEPLTALFDRTAAAFDTGNVMLARSHSGLRVESVALVCQVLTIDKEFLTSRIAKLPSSSMERVDAGLQFTLALSP